MPQAKPIKGLERQTGLSARIDVKGLSGALANRTPAKSRDQSPTAELRQIARAVRRIGNGYRDNAETIAIEKETIVDRLGRIAGLLEAP